jgi:hypothetical protein
MRERGGRGRKSRVKGEDARKEYGWRKREREERG